MKQHLVCFLSRAKNCRLNDFVKISAIWSIEGICKTCRCWAAIFSLTKWKSNSICLVLTCKIRLDTRAIALKLSTQTVGTLIDTIPSSWRRELNHVISAIVCARLLYSASVLDLEIETCFFMLQERRLPPR